MGRSKAVLIGPMCLIARTTSEPPATAEPIGPPNDPPNSLWWFGCFVSS